QTRTFRPGPGIGPVMIEDDPHPNLPGIGHDLVENLQTCQSLEVRIEAEIDAVGYAAGIEQLVGKRQSDRVVAQLLHLVHHALVTARPEAVWGVGAALEAKPVDPGDLHVVSLGIDDLIALSME